MIHSPRPPVKMGYVKRLSATMTPCARILDWFLI